MHYLLKTTVVILIGFPILLVSSECYSGSYDQEIGAPMDRSDFYSSFSNSLSSSEAMIDLQCGSRNQKKVNEALKKLVSDLFGSVISKNLEKRVKGLSVELRNSEYLKFIKKGFERKQNDS